MLRGLAWGLSVVFHPLLIPTYMLLLLIVINPYLFGVSSLQAEGAQMSLLLVFLYTFFIPAVSFTVMYFLGMISDIQVKDRQERIGPYLITGMLYIWVYYNLSKTGQFPDVYISFILGVVIALFLSFFINLFSKISAHTVGMGGLVGMLVVSYIWFSSGSFIVSIGDSQYELTSLHLLVGSIVLAGAVGTSRLLLKAHNDTDIFGGYVVGFCAQIIAFVILFVI